jgi:hypothetical protein
MESSDYLTIEHQVNMLEIKNMELFQLGLKEVLLVQINIFLVTWR